MSKPAKPSKLDRAKHKGDLLNQIMRWKREEVPKQMDLVPLDQVRAFAQLAAQPLDFAAALTAHQGASLIAEVKSASPSKGLIAAQWDPKLIAETYARAGAAAISCLTDSRFFQGQLQYLTDIKERLREIGRQVPVLRKDFIYHDYQVYEPRMAGADAVLLIVAVLSDRDLQNLIATTRLTGMSALVEVHNDPELDRALAIDAQIIGVNNRDLTTFEVDIENTYRLRRRIPKDRIVVGESGIRTAADVSRMAEMGCDAILVGETFCRLAQERRGAKVHEFVRAGQTQS